MITSCHDSAAESRRMSCSTTSPHQAVSSGRRNSSASCTNRDLTYQQPVHVAQNNQAPISQKHHNTLQQERPFDKQHSDQSDRSVASSSCDHVTGSRSPQEVATERSPLSRDQYQHPGTCHQVPNTGNTLNTGNNFVTRNNLNTGNTLDAFNNQGVNNQNQFGIVSTNNGSYNGGYNITDEDKLYLSTRTDTARYHCNNTRYGGGGIPVPPGCVPNINISTPVTPPGSGVAVPSISTGAYYPYPPQSGLQALQDSCNSWMDPTCRYGGGLDPHKLRYDFKGIILPSRVGGMGRVLGT